MDYFKKKKKICFDISVIAGCKSFVSVTIWGNGCLE